MSGDPSRYPPCPFCHEQLRPVHKSGSGWIEWFGYRCDACHLRLNAALPKPKVRPLVPTDEEFDTGLPIVKSDLYRVPGGMAWALRHPASDWRAIGFAPTIVAAYADMDQLMREAVELGGNKMTADVVLIRGPHEWKSPHPKRG